MVRGFGFRFPFFFFAILYSFFHSPFLLSSPLEVFAQKAKKIGIFDDYYQKGKSEDYRLGVLSTHKLYLQATQEKESPVRKFGLKDTRVQIENLQAAGAFALALVSDPEVPLSHKTLVLEKLAEVPPAKLPQEELQLFLTHLIHQKEVSFYLKDVAISLHRDFVVTPQEWSEVSLTIQQELTGKRTSAIGQGLSARPHLQALVFLLEVISHAKHPYAEDYPWVLELLSENELSLVQGALKCAGQFKYANSSMESLLQAVWHKSKYHHDLQADEYLSALTQMKVNALRALLNHPSLETRSFERVVQAIGEGTHLSEISSSLAQAIKEERLSIAQCEGILEALKHASHDRHPSVVSLWVELFSSLRSHPSGETVSQKALSWVEQEAVEISSMSLDLSSDTDLQIALRGARLIESVLTFGNTMHQTSEIREKREQALLILLKLAGQDNTILQGVAWGALLQWKRPDFETDQILKLYESNPELFFSRFHKILKRGVDVEIESVLTHWSQVREKLSFYSISKEMELIHLSPPSSLESWVTVLGRHDFYQKREFYEALFEKQKELSQNADQNSLVLQLAGRYEHFLIDYARELSKSPSRLEKLLKQEEAGEFAFYLPYILKCDSPLHRVYYFQKTLSESADKVLPLLGDILAAQKGDKLELILPTLEVLDHAQWLGTPLSLVDEITALLKHEEEDIRLGAAKNLYLRRLKLPPHYGVEFERMIQDSSMKVRQLGYLALTEDVFGESPQQIKWVRLALKDEALQIRTAAIDVLGKLLGTQSELQDEIMGFQNSSDPEIRQAALRAIQTGRESVEKNEAFWAFMNRCLSDSSHSIRLQATQMLVLSMKEEPLTSVDVEKIRANFSIKNDALSVASARLYMKLETDADKRTDLAIQAMASQDLALVREAIELVLAQPQDLVWSHQEKFIGSLENAELTHFSYLVNFIQSLAQKAPQRTLGLVMMRFHQASDEVKVKYLEVFQRLGPMASQAIPLIEPFLDSTDKKVQLKAIYALTKMEEEALSVAPQIAALLQTEDNDYQYAVLGFITASRYYDEDVREKLLKLLGQSRLCFQAASAIGNLYAHREAFLPELLESLPEEKRVQQQIAILRVLTSWGEGATEAKSIVQEKLHSIDSAVRYNAVVALGAMGPGAKETAPMILAMLKDESASFLVEAVKAFRKMQVPPEDVIEEVERCHSKVTSPYQRNETTHAIAAFKASATP